MVDFANGILSQLPPQDQFTKKELIAILATACQEACDRAVAESQRLNELRLEQVVNGIEQHVNDRLSALARDFERRITGESA